MIILDGKTLTETDAWAIANALRVAAETYSKDATESDAPRVAQQFRDQSTEALRLADAIEGAA